MQHKTVSRYWNIFLLYWCEIPLNPNLETVDLKLPLLMLNFLQIILNTPNMFISMHILIQN